VVGGAGGSGEGAPAPKRSARPERAPPLAIANWAILLCSPFARRHLSLTIITRESLSSSSSLARARAETERPPSSPGSRTPFDSSSLCPAPRRLPPTTMALAQRPPSLLMMMMMMRPRAALPPLLVVGGGRRRRRGVGGTGRGVGVVVLAGRRDGGGGGGGKSGSSSSSETTTTTTTTTTTSGPQLIHESLAARPAVCDGGLPDPEMCLIDSDDEELVAERIVVGLGAAAKAAKAAAAAGAAASASLASDAPSPSSPSSSPQTQQPQQPLPPPLYVPPAPEGTVLDEATSRGRWLVGLLIVQSLSSVVLERFEPLIREHLAVTLFLTMLVGAGGNAGNQSAIKVVRSMATGQLDASWPSAKAALSRQARVALVLGGGLAAAGYVRVLVAAAMGGGGFGGGSSEASTIAMATTTATTTTTTTTAATTDAAAIAVSLLAIVVTSVMLGTALPFALARVGVDPVHSGTTIQVASDILGVLVTCLACSFFYSGGLDGAVSVVFEALGAVGGG
jgi:hypothetical protein